MNKPLYTIEVTRLPDAANGDWSDPRYRAVLTDASGDGIVVTGGSPRGLAVKAIARFEAMQKADKFEQEGSGLILAERPTIDKGGVRAGPEALVQAQNAARLAITGTHENSPMASASKPQIVDRKVAVTAGDIPILLRQAIEANMRVTIRYKGTEDDYASDRTITPMRIDRVGHGWDKVVSAYCHRANGVRSFRLDRIERVEMEA